MIDCDGLRMVRRTITAMVCAAALVAAAGCGETDQEQAREVVQDYVDARNDGDFELVCDLYSDSFKQELAIGENCPAFVEEQTSGAAGEISVVDVRVNGDRATADLDVTQGSEGPSRVALVLEREDDDWKITGLQ
ncbi:MAG: nuclear transport factor 2 family protein [Solirubrobacterales bacterium]